MIVFLTGATGLLGNNLLRLIVAQGDQAVVLVRGEPDPRVFRGLADNGQVEFLRGDLADTGALRRGIERSDAAIHAAGLIHLGWRRLGESMAVNRDGTRAIVDACLEHQRPLAHVGTVNALAVGKRRQPADETTPIDNAGGQVDCSYVLSKRAAVAAVLAGVDRGLSATITHPGFMLGPNDWKPSSGRLIVEIDKTYRPVAPSGGVSVCDVRDVAAAVLAALRRVSDGRIESGRQYILAGENWTYWQLWRTIAERVGRPRPVAPAGPILRWFGARFGDVVSRFTAAESDLNSAAVGMSAQYHWYDSSRAIQELNYQTRDVDESLRDSIQFLREHGMIRQAVPG